MKLDEEHLLVGFMLLDEEQRQLVRERGINPYVIQTPELSAIVKTLASMDELGFPVDVVVLSRTLMREGTEVTVQYLTDLQAMASSRGHPSNATVYAEMVIENYKSQRAMAAAYDVMERLAQDPRLDLVAELAEALKILTTDTDIPRGGWYADIIPPHLAHLDKRWSGEGEKEYIETPWPKLNQFLRGGFYNGENIVIGARPGMGKTVMALSLAHCAAKQGKPVAFFSAEMSVRALLRRAGSEFTGIASTLIDIPRPLNDEKQEQIRRDYARRLQEEMSQLEVYVDDKSSPTVQHIDDTVKRLGNIGMVVVDYMGLMGDKYKSATEKMDAISLGLQRIAKDHNIPVVSLSQLSRSVEKDKPYRPSMGHLRDSGQIEANAHIVMLLYRKMYYVHQGMIEGNYGDTDTMEVIIGKNREADTGVVRLKFDGAAYQLREIE